MCSHLMPSYRGFGVPIMMILLMICIVCSGSYRLAYCYDGVVVVGNDESVDR